MAESAEELTGGILRGTALALLLAASLAQVAPPDPLLRARQLYNSGRFADAAAAAAEARQIASLAHPAAIVFARARLELFRQSPDSRGLAEARDALRTVDLSKLSPRDDVDYQIAVGVTVFLEGEAAKLTDRYSAAADFFDAALARADVIENPERDKLFEWWATALDRHAQASPDAERRSTYVRLVERAANEIARSDASASAMFWYVAANRGAGDHERAWSAALSSWIRAAKLGPRGVALRTELDRLVTTAVLPDRARALTPAGDQQAKFKELLAQWEEHKKYWDAPAA